MAQPTPKSVHTNAVLTNVSTAYIQRQDMFIAQRVFPTVSVDKQSDVYYTYTKNDWFRDEAAVRPPGTESAGSGYGLSTASYGCTVWAFHKDVDDQTRANADAGINVDRDATEFVTQRLLLRLERAWAARYFAASVWATDVTPSALWSNYATSDPISDIETGKRTVLASTGFMPNTLTVGYDVWVKLKNHPDIVDRIKGGATGANPAISTQQAVAAILEVERLFVASAIYASNVEGETAAYAFVHGKHALLTYSPPTPSLLTPSAGYTFAWTGVSGGLGQNVGVKTFRMEHLASDRVEGEVAFDQKVVATDLGYFFNGAVS